MTRPARACLLSLVFSGCSLAGHPVSQPIGGEGGRLVVILLPLPPDPARPSFHLAGISALREDGTTTPLPLLHADAPVGNPTAERRLAAQTLPAGRYTGLAVTATSSAKGRAATGPPPPSEPIVAPLAFTIEKGRAIVLCLRFDARTSGDPDIGPTPVVSASLPQRPAPGLIGVATSRGTNEVTIFDKISGQIAGIVLAGREPGGLAIDKDRRRAYVAAPGEDMIQTIGLLEQDVLSRLLLRGGDGPAELALTPDGRTLLSANEGSSTVSVIDSLSLVETGRVPVGNGPRSILIDRSGRRAYTFNASASTLTVLDIAARAAVGTIATDAGPLRGEFSRAGDKLFVIHRSSPYLTVIDPLSLTVTAKVYIGPGAAALKVDTRTDRIYLARRGEGALEVYDPLSLLPVDKVPTEGDVSFLSIDDEGNNLYLILPEMNQVQVVRIVGKETTARTEVGDGPARVALLGER